MYIFTYFTSLPVNFLKEFTSNLYEFLLILHFSVLIYPVNLKWIFINRNYDNPYSFKNRINVLLSLNIRDI